jgi:hypothetical protein
MQIRRTWQFAVGILLLAGISCKSHPELSKTNDKGSSAWNHSGGSSTLSIFSIKATNLITTPAGDKLVELDINCDGFHKLFDLQMATFAEPESGAVKVGTDGASLSDKNWHTDSTELKIGRVYVMKPAEPDRNDLLRRMRHANEFEFEFTPKGGKPQRSKFRLLNISALLDQDDNCKEAVASIH